MMGGGNIIILIVSAILILGFFALVLGFLGSVAGDSSEMTEEHIKGSISIGPCEEEWVCLDTQEDKIIAAVEGAEGREACEEMCIEAYRESKSYILNCLIEDRDDDEKFDCECRCVDLNE